MNDVAVVIILFTQECAKISAAHPGGIEFLDRELWPHLGSMQRCGEPTGCLGNGLRRGFRGGEQGDILTT
jgi:hypothetical protein